MHSHSKSQKVISHFCHVVWKYPWLLVQRDLWAPYLGEGSSHFCCSLMELSRVGWGPAGAGEGWEKGGGEGSPHLGLDGRGQSILTQPFLQISHPLISHFVSYVFISKLISSPGWLVGTISLVYLRYLEPTCRSVHHPSCACVCVCHPFFLPFLPPAGLSTVHLRRHRYLSTSTQTQRLFTDETHKTKRTNTQTLSSNELPPHMRGKGHHYHLRGALWWTILM